MATTSKSTSQSGRFTTGPSALMLRFSESVSFDSRLAVYDIAGSKAHAAMLAHTGIITAEERDAIHCGLDTILAEIAAGNFIWSIEQEDVHMNIEARLTALVPAAAKLHTARSRNDQVATDMRLFFKDACSQIETRLTALLRTLVARAEKDQSIIIPGYTHLQRAQPVSLAHHWLAYAEMFGRDLERFAVVRDHANWSPLGSGALAGTTLPIDREFTAKALGFVDVQGCPRVTPNSLDAVADRDTFVEFATACALVGTHASRVSEDLILWSTAEFGFATLPEAFTTGSSLMPQKKNPDACELLRGKAARLQGHVTMLLTLTKGLPLTYNRDLQEDKPPVFDAFDQTLICLEVLEAVMAGLVIHATRCEAAASDPNLLATDLADLLVQSGMPFRDAHHAVGALVKLSETQGCALDAIPDDAAQLAVPRLPANWKSVFNLRSALAKRNNSGMPGPKAVADAILRWKANLSE
ncbi:MAG: argininosuccinate lyase [Verrucomicrobiota bacterium]|nr:argininosuccinate lyase [Verrucomicrobiota bacterium]